MIAQPFGIVARGIRIETAESAAAAFDFNIHSIYIARTPTICDEVCDFVYAYVIGVAAEIIIINQ
jgi:hypothetical protein